MADVKSTKDVKTSTIQKVYYESKSHTEASRVLSKQFGLTDRAWRYKLRIFEEKGFLEPTTLVQHNRRDIRTINKVRKKFKISIPQPPPKPAVSVEEPPENNVMVTIHFKIKYEKIGAKGFHPFYLEGFFSKIMKRNFDMSEVYNTMNIVQGKLEEFGALIGYLELMKDDYEHGIEIEELSQTRKGDNEFKYDYGRRPVRIR